MMRIVIDVPVLTAAFRSNSGAGAALLVAAANGRLHLLATPALFHIYDLALRQAQRRSENWLSHTDIDQVLAGLAGLAEWFAWHPQTDDMDDEALPELAIDTVVEAAVSGHADALVTFDVHRLGREAAARGLRVARPGEIVMEMAG